MIKRLSACIREYLLPTVLTPISMVGEVVMEVLIPYYMADLIDLGINVGDMNAIKSIGLKLVLFALISLLCGVFGGTFASIASAGFAKNVSHDMYHNIQRFSFSNIDKFSSAGLVTRMTTDVTNVQMAYMVLTRMAFRAPVMMVFALIMAFRINSRLALIFAFAIPVLGCGMAYLMKHAFPLFEKLFKFYDKLNNVVQENIRGIRVVKAFIREDREIKKFHKAADDLYETGLRAETYLAYTGPLMQICMYTCTLLISWFGAKLIIGGSMTTGQLMSLITYVMQILMGLIMLSAIIVMCTIASASAERIIEVLDEEPDIKNCDDPETELADGSIRFENVSFAYPGSANCLTNIDLDIKSGETIGILGSTGSGKSSLVQLIPRLYDASEGRVLVGGKDVRELDLTTLRKNVAMVLQKNLLFEGTVESNLKWGNENASEEEMKRACEIAQADEFVSQMPDGYKSAIEQGGANLSGGQRQRLCIARALLTSPKIIIFDDSTSAVDTATEAKIREGLAHAMPNVTKLIIAQRVSSVKDADRIVVINNGAISHVGTHEELLASSENYRNICAIQTSGGDFDEPGIR